MPVLPGRRAGCSLRPELRLLRASAKSGHDGDCALVACRQAAGLTQFLEDVAQIVVGLGVIRLDGEGALVGCRSLIEMALFCKNSAQVIVSLDVIRIDGEGLPVGCRSLVEMA